MAHIVDDAENIKQFMTAMNNASATFSQKYSQRSRTGSENTAISEVQSPSTTMAIMDMNDRPSKPLETSAEPTQELEDSTYVLLSYRDVNKLQPDLSNTSIQAKLPTKQRQLFEDLSDSDTVFDGQQRKIRPEILPESAIVNKAFNSPLLAGLRAPPPTPESRANRDYPDRNDIEELVGHTFNQYFGTKTTVSGLGDSHWAPQQSSPVSKELLNSQLARSFDGHTQRKGDTPDLSSASHQNQNKPHERLLRDSDFERMSFKASNASPSLDTSDEVPAVATNSDTGISPQKYGFKQRTSSKSKRESAQDDTRDTRSPIQKPPHLQTIGTRSSTSHSAGRDPKLQTLGEDIPLVEGIRAGLQSFMSKYYGMKNVSSPSSEVTSSEETVAPTICGVSDMAPCVRLGNEAPQKEAPPLTAQPRAELIVTEAHITDYQEPPLQQRKGERSEVSNIPPHLRPTQMEPKPDTAIKPEVTLRPESEADVHSVRPAISLGSFTRTTPKKVAVSSEGQMLASLSTPSKITKEPSIKYNEEMSPTTRVHVFGSKESPDNAADSSSCTQSSSDRLETPSANTTDESNVIYFDSYPKPVTRKTPGKDLPLHEVSCIAQKQADFSSSSTY